MLLSQADSYEHSEERRLFYVAMTRAKERVLFLVKKDNKSAFIHEIEKQNNERIKSQIS